MNIRRHFYKNQLGLIPIVAPATFDPDAEPLNIYTFFVCHPNANKKFIVSIAPTTSTTTLAVVANVTYIWGEEVGSIMTETTIASGTVTWTAGSIKRFVLVLSTASVISLPITISGSVWGYLGPKVTYFGQPNISSFKYLHCSDASAMTSIGGFITSGLTGILTIPQNVTTVNNNGFQGCTAIKELVLNNVTTLNTQAFYQCSGFNKDLTITKANMSIGSNAFNGCSNFTALNLPVGYLGNGTAGKIFNFSAKFASTIASRLLLNQSVLNLPDNFGTLTLGATNVNNMLNNGYPNFVTDAAARGITIV